MYNGEVKVRQANIQAFLAVAEKFRVRGLCNNETAATTSGGQGNGSSSGRCSPVYSKTGGGSITSSKTKSHNHSASSPTQHHSSQRAKSPSLSHNKRPASPSGHRHDHKDSNNYHKRLREDRYSDHADLDHGPLTPDVSIKEESHYSSQRRDRSDGRSERDGHRGHRGSEDYSDYLHGSDRDFDQHAMSSALLGL